MFLPVFARKGRGESAPCGHSSSYVTKRLLNAKPNITCPMTDRLATYSPTKANYISPIKLTTCTYPLISLGRPYPLLILPSSQLSTQPSRFLQYLATHLSLLATLEALLSYLATHLSLIATHPSSLATLLALKPTRISYSATHLFLKATHLS
jgi:hypothetical protein